MPLMFMLFTAVVVNTAYVLKKGKQKQFSKNSQKTFMQYNSIIYPYTVYRTYKSL